MRLLPSTAIIVTTLSVGAAYAADLKPAYKAPPPAPVVYNWSGFYIGGFAGGAWGGDASSTDLNGWDVAGSNWSHGLDSSFIGGGTIGWNWQAPGSPWVWGLEGEFGYIKLEGLAATSSLGPATVSTSTVGEWYGFAGGRLGYAWDRTLLYAKGGAAFVDLNRATFTPGSITATNDETLIDLGDRRASNGLGSTTGLLQDRISLYRSERRRRAARQPVPPSLAS